MDRNEIIGKIWRTIIKYQIHDVMWIEVTDLRRKGINYDTECASKSHRIMEEIAQTLAGTDSTSIAIFNGLPASRRAVIEIDGRTCQGMVRRSRNLKGELLEYVNSRQAVSRVFRSSGEIRRLAGRPSCPQG